MKYVLAAISIILLLIVISATAFYLGQNFNKTSNTLPSPSTTNQNAQTTPNLTPTPTQAQSFRAVPAGGVLTYAAYTIDIPLDWTYTKDDGKDIDALIITKGNYKLQIMQGGMGGAMCLYPGDADTEGPSSRFTSFVAITTLSGNLLRRVEGGPQSAISICEKQKFGWEQPTSFGAISYLVPGRDPEILKIMDAMITSLKKR